MFIFEIFAVAFLIQSFTFMAATLILLAPQILFTQNCMNIFFFPHHYLSEIPTFPSIP